MSIDVARMPLIMDVGMYNARDTRFYLKKGFRVVAVEANPSLVQCAQEELAPYIESGQLVVEGIGLAARPAITTFFINLDNGQWSSFDRAWGTRNGTRYQEIAVRCEQPQWLFEKHGVPYYLKIDIEGFDIEVVRALRDLSARPRYISIEEHQAYYFAELWAVGCRGFKIVNQKTLHTVKCPDPALEGGYVDAQFDSTMSGPFGDEVPGVWQNFDCALERYLVEIRSPSRGYLMGDSWFDIHGRCDPI
jgi:FkbM family methyltransferase